MKDKNALFLESYKAQVMKTPLCGWADLLESTASTAHLADKDTVQEAIDEFVRAYGIVESPFDRNLFSKDSLLTSVLKECENKLNSK